MPGPVSDSYDPEFSTESNANDIGEAIEEVRSLLDGLLNVEPKDIVSVVHGSAMRLISSRLSERSWRILRFCTERALDSL